MGEGNYWNREIGEESIKTLKIPTISIVLQGDFCVMEFMTVYDIGWVFYDWRTKKNAGIIKG